MTRTATSLSFELSQPHSPGPEHTPQEVLKATTMEQELHGTTWESQSVVRRLLPYDSKLVAKVHDLLGNAVELPNGWPISDGEKEHYSSFAKLLNDTFRIARDVLGTKAGSYYSSLRFSTYDKPTGDSVDTGCVLKPGLVGCDEDIRADQTVFWREIRIPVAVNVSWSEMVVQAATYAHCMFAVSSGRQYVLVIALEHVSCEVRFLFFHRGGLTSSPIFDLKTKDSFAMFVSGMIGLASVNDQVSGGFDDSFNNSEIYLPIGGLWRVEEWLSTRHCVRGRATQVVRVSRKTAAASGSRNNGATGENAGSDASGACMGTPAAKKAIEKVQRQPESNTLNCHDQPITPPDDGLVEDLVVKDTWPLRQRDYEKQMYAAAQGLFGVPEVLASYEVRGPNDPNTTERFLPADSKPWDVWQAQSADPTPEIRVHTRHLYKIIGRDLLSASSPRELLEGILHAMIGYLNYYEKGYMHRDISIGNVMLLEKKLTRPAFPLFRDKTECIGMLIDGDHAVQWTDSGRAKAAHRSGTLPFVSYRLIAAWHQGEPYEHSPSDDLESFLWLLIWCIYCIIEEKLKDGTADSSWMEILRSQSVKVHYSSRKAILVHLNQKDNSEYDILSPLEALFQPLLSDWDSILPRARGELLPLLRSTTRSNGALLTATRKYFGEFLTKGFYHLETLPESWDDLTLRRRDVGDSRLGTLLRQVRELLFLAIFRFASVIVRLYR